MRMHATKGGTHRLRAHARKSLLEERLIAQVVQPHIEAVLASPRELRGAPAGSVVRVEHRHLQALVGKAG